MKNNLYFFLILCFTSNPSLCNSYMAKGSCMRSKTININANIFGLDESSQLIALEKLILTAQVLQGNGLIQAPDIIIKVKKFNFTGTISSDNSCTIITEEPFDHTMFKQHGNGTFNFTLENMSTKETNQAALEKVENDDHDAQQPNTLQAFLSWLRSSN